jgi:N-acetylneuraminic acid mutarotase
VLNGRLYVMGGYRSNKLQVLEMTEENGLAWTVKADLPANRHGAASVVFQGKIWVMGGNIGGAMTASVLTYDVKADAWAMAPSLPGPIGGHTATAIDGRIYLAILSLTFLYDAAWSQVVGGPGYLFGTSGGVLLG